MAPTLSLTNDNCWCLIRFNLFLEKTVPKNPHVLESYGGTKEITRNIWALRMGDVE